MKNLKQELNEMKFLFGYKPGKVLSEQNLPNMEEYGMEENLSIEGDVFEMSEPDVMEPEVKPDTDRDVEERPSRPGRPDRDPSRLPYTDPDTHPQGENEDEVEYELEIDDEPKDEVEYELEIDDEPRPMRSMGRRDSMDDEPRRPRPMRSMGRRGSIDDEVNEPFVDDVDSEYENSDLSDLVKKYLSKRG